MHNGKGLMVLAFVTRRKNPRSHALTPRAMARMDIRASSEGATLIDDLEIGASGIFKHLAVFFDFIKSTHTKGFVRERLSIELCVNF